MPFMSSSPSSRQLSGITFASYSSVSLVARALVSAESGDTVLSITTKGFPSSFNSRITRSSHSLYSSRGMSVIEPSVVITSPIVEWSVITF